MAAPATTESHRSASPTFVVDSIGFSYGEIFSRPGLDLKFRALAAVSAHAAMAISPPQLRTHVAAALHLGWTRAEIIEVLIQTASHAGVPAALNALAECHALLVERDADCQSCGEDVSSDGQL